MEWLGYMVSFFFKIASWYFFFFSLFFVSVSLPLFFSPSLSLSPCLYLSWTCSDTNNFLKHPELIQCGWDTPDNNNKKCDQNTLTETDKFRHYRGAGVEGCPWIGYGLPLFIVIVSGSTIIGWPNHHSFDPQPNLFIIGNLEMEREGVIKGLENRSLLFPVLQLFQGY